ncbi:MAG: hypothetical protein QM723_24385 [Myxococcaceae bacterium]
MKAVSILLILVGLAAMGMGLASAPSSASNATPLPKVAMRELGAVPAGSVAPEKAAPPPAEKPARVDAPVANNNGNGKALENALAKAAEKPSDELAAPEKPAAKAPAAEKTEKTAEKAAPPPPEKAAPEKAPAPAPEKAAAAPPPPAPAKAPAKAPAEKAAAAPAPAEAADSPAPAALGIMNLRASDTADVYVDGKKVGGSPLKGFKVKPGKHKVRFDCYQASGETKPGTTQSYDVAADAERDIDYECPVD